MAGPDRRHDAPHYRNAEESVDDALNQALRLPCGAVLPNRLAKAATTEGLADRDLRATPRLCRLYERWSQGGAGLLITGNVMIDHRAMTGPGGVVLASRSDG